MRFGTRSLAVLGVLACARSAGAEPSLDLRRFHPPADSRGALFTEPTGTPGPGAWDVSVVGSYAHGLVELEAPGGESFDLVKHQLSLDYAAAVGIGDWLALGASLPSILYQSSEDDSGAPDELSQQALGDLALHAKTSLLQPGELGGFGFGTLLRVTLPTGQDESFAAEEGPTGELRALGELQLIVLQLRATAGVRVRTDDQRLFDEEFGHDLPWGFGVTVRPQALGLDDAGRWTWTAEIHGAVAVTPELASGPQSPLVYGASARYAFGELSALAGFELPIGDAAGNPDVRAVLGLSWAPRVHDADQDGVEDERDECPELAEDRDRVEDHDGCPDWDDEDTDAAAP